MADRDDYDRSSKWLIQHRGDAILRMAGVHGIRAWRALQAEVVQPRQLPDGLLEVFFEGEETPDYYILEIATYPEERVREQVLRDAMLVYLARRVLPEVLTVVLHPKGSLRLDGSGQFASRRGRARLEWGWHVVELWTLSAEQLLAAHDVGLVPWLPLTQFEGLPEAMLRRCRELIDQQAPIEEKANLLAVTQVMTRLRYNDSQLLTLLGGSLMLTESPLIQELWAERGQNHVLAALKARYPSVPQDLVASVRSIEDGEQLLKLSEVAATCPDLDAFRLAIKDMAHPS